MRKLMGCMCQPHPLQIRQRSIALGSDISTFLHAQAEPDVLQRTQPAKELRLLKHVTQLVVLGRSPLPVNFNGPSSGSVNPASRLSRVLLPQPEGPSSTTNSPCRAWKLKLRNTGALPG